MSTLKKIFRPLTLISCMALLLFSCSGEDILAPSGATLTLIANPTSIPADGSSTATVQAIVLGSEGEPIQGVTVYFSTTLGSIAESATTEDGKAQVVLTAGILEGAATITAFSGSLKETLQVYIGFQETSILLLANPQEIPADGVSTSEISAFVTEQKGIIPDGTEVFFTTTRGTIEPQAVTTNGLATAILTSGIIEGTATITAIVINTSQTTTMSIGIPVWNITLSANPSTFEVETADLQRHDSMITATVWDAAGVPIRDKSVVIDSDLGQLGSAGTATQTDENGQVQDPFDITIAVPLGTSQSIKITATSGAISTTITITITNTG